VILGIILLTLLILPEDKRAFALIAAGAVLVVLQGIILWANRGMITPYAQAQRYYLAEDYESARGTLEQLATEGKPDFKTLTLLGNTYRQLGLLDKSKETLTEALQIAPNHQFPLYGFGRTLLIAGEYAQAVEVIQAALAAGAPPGIQVDLGEALVRIGETAHNRDTAQNVLRSAASVVQDDPPRALMVTYLRYQLGDSTAPDVDSISAGLAYWQATAERFRSTPYGVSLMQDVLALKRLTGDD
jgi:tetratricopeptide (TPR) repeat protein